MTSWPDLPTKGFVIGRPATEEDVRAGNAVFSQAGTDEGTLGVQIPQYVLWLDELGKEHPMFLVQAEVTAHREDVMGLRGFDGSETVATLAEIRLLGTEKPS